MYTHILDCWFGTLLHAWFELASVSFHPPPARVGTLLVAWFQLALMGQLLAEACYVFVYVWDGLCFMYVETTPPPRLAAAYLDYDR